MLISYNLSFLRKISFLKKDQNYACLDKKLCFPIDSHWAIFLTFPDFPQVFISGTKSECKHLLQTILQNRRLCTLLSPYFTPVASPNEFVTLYEKVVAFLSEDNSDVVFMLLTKVKYSSPLHVVCGLL